MGDFSLEDTGPMKRSMMVTMFDGKRDGHDKRREESADETKETKKTLAIHATIGT